MQWWRAHFIALDSWTVVWTTLAVLPDNGERGAGLQLGMALRGRRGYGAGVGRERITVHGGTREESSSGKYNGFLLF